MPNHYSFPMLCDDDELVLVLVGQLSTLMPGMKGIDLYEFVDIDETKLTSSSSACNILLTNFNVGFPKADSRREIFACFVPAILARSACDKSFLILARRMASPNAKCVLRSARPCWYSGSSSILAR